jgi:hypothetical protein
MSAGITATPGLLDDRGMDLSGKKKKKKWRSQSELISSILDSVKLDKALAAEVLGREIEETAI